MSAASNRGKRRAKLVPPPAQIAFVEHVSRKRRSERNRVIAYLSMKAGLRACEISGLDWSMVLDASGGVAESVEVGGHIAKLGSGRRIPCHRKLRAALRTLHLQQGRPMRGPVCLSERGGPMTAGTISNWFAQQYRELGLEGCSSHSGRRTMITMAARSLAKVGGSLRDVQELAGHRNLATTEGYIEGDRAVQKRLVDML
jgi:integrase/recombinase XerD